MSYRFADYAASLHEYGSPVRLEAVRGWVLRRTIPGGGWDVTSCYPLFRCERWLDLSDDIARLRADGAVSLVLVADPLAEAAPAAVRAACPDVARPFKEHFVVELRGGQPFGNAHHRRHVRRFARNGEVVTIENPAVHLDDWCRLYEQLIARHDVQGPARFSRRAFARQLALPGALLLSAVLEGRTVGMQLWFRDGERMDYHLAGYDPAGYRSGASHALTAGALELGRREGRTTALLGSGAGLVHDSFDGLTRYKAGWATGTRTAWLGGAVLDAAAYRALPSPTGTGFFPAYRDPAIAIHAEEPAHAS